MTLASRKPWRELEFGVMIALVVVSNEALE